MFVVKYHAKGHKTKYLGWGTKKAVVNKRCAIAFGESFREQFKQVESEYCTLEDIKVSDTAEMMYKSSYIKVGSIKW